MGIQFQWKFLKKLVIHQSIYTDGTSINYLDDIKSNGLKPMSRQYVHLSEDVETATLVGNRKKRGDNSSKNWYRTSTI